MTLTQTHHFCLCKSLLPNYFNLSNCLNQKRAMLVIVWLPHATNVQQALYTIYTYYMYILYILYKHLQLQTNWKHPGSNPTTMLPVTFGLNIDKKQRLTSDEADICQYIGPLFFLIYINDIHRVIQCCKEHHFADDANLFHTSKSVKNLNNQVSRDMKHLNNWLSANIISFKVETTELVILKSPRKVLLFF